MAPARAALQQFLGCSRINLSAMDTLMSDFSLLDEINRKSKLINFSSEG